MLTTKEKIAIWVLAIANPIICWSVAYLFWHETNRARYTLASRAAAIVIGVLVALAVVSLVLR